MSFITDTLSAATVLFAACSVLAILVTGFFVGRYWFRLMGGADKDPGESWKAYAVRRNRQDN